MSDDRQGPGWWQGADGTWGPPGHGPDADRSAREVGPRGPAPGATSDADDGPTGEAGASPPSTEARWAAPRRPGALRPKVILDSGLWVVVWVVGAILLIVLILVAVSQVSPSPKKVSVAIARGAAAHPPGRRADFATSVVGPAVPEPVERAPDVGQLLG